MYMYQYVLLGQLNSKLKERACCINDTIRICWNIEHKFICNCYFFYCCISKCMQHIVDVKNVFVVATIEFVVVPEIEPKYMSVTILIINNIVYIIHKIRVITKYKYIPCIRNMLNIFVDTAIKKVNLNIRYVLYGDKCPRLLLIQARSVYGNTRKCVSSGAWFHCS